MPEHLLNNPDVRPALQHARCGPMPKLVREYPAFDAGAVGEYPKDEPEAASAETLAAPAEEERGVGNGIGWAAANRLLLLRPSALRLSR